MIDLVTIMFLVGAMSSALNDELEPLTSDRNRVRAALVAQGFEKSLLEIERQISFFPRLLQETLNYEIGGFHNMAGRLPNLDNLDYGAILLEMAGDTTENPAKKIRYFEEAQYRTIWACQNLEFGNRGMPNAKRLKGKLELLRDHR